MDLMSFLGQYLPQSNKVTPAKRAALQIIYETKDISTDIAEHLVSASMKDAISGEADTLDITLEDRPNLWANDWLPTKGAQIKASLLLTAWWSNETETVRIPLGTFYIDDIGLSGGGNTTSSVELNTVSIPDGVVRDIARTRSWEKVQLKVVAQDVANSAGLGLHVDTDENPTLDRVEQTDEADLAFLKRLCNDNGLCLKVADKKIVIFDEAKYDEQESIAEIDKYSLLELESYEFHSKVQEVYTACTVTYQKARDKSKIEATFEAPKQSDSMPSATEKKVLRVNKEVPDIGAALRLAKKELYNKNKEEITGRLTLRGRPDLYAGACITLVNFGKFSGKYLITEVSADISGNYVSELTLRRALNGYT